MIATVICLLGGRGAFAQRRSGVRTLAETYADGEMRVIVCHRELELFRRVVPGRICRRKLMSRRSRPCLANPVILRQGCRRGDDNQDLTNFQQVLSLGR